MFKKTFMMFLFSCSFVFCGAMLNSGDHPSLEDKKELFDIFQTIRVTQYSCGYAEVHNHMVPRRFKGYSTSELQDKQKSLFPRMRELKTLFTEEQLVEISDESDKYANVEIETTADIFSLGGAQEGCTVQ